MRRLFAFRTRGMQEALACSKAKEQPLSLRRAGVAWALGYRDGRHLPVDEVVAAAARIARVLTVLLSFDIMSG